MASVLSGIRVVEISTGLPGALTGMYLADQGADVIRVERPGSAEHPHPVWDRGKRSIALDLAEPAGRVALDRLLDTADILLTSMSVETANRLGLDGTTPRRDRPRLIHCSITGYGSHGAERDRAGYDALIAARHGLQWDQPSYRRDEAGDWLEGQPIFLHLPLPSYGATFLAVTAIAAALFARARTGEGQLVETSLAQGAMLFTTMWRVSAEHETPAFQLLPRTARGSVYECGDGSWVHFMPLADSPSRMLKLLKIEVTEPVTAQTVMAPGPELAKEMRAGFRAFSRPELLRQFAEAAIPVAPVQSGKEMYVNPQLLHNAMVIEVEDPELGTIRQTGIPFVLERNPTGPITGRPLPGQHTAEVLTEIGLPADEIDRLVSTK
jgi:crotonobetainyl-CoA:carnitine CoA-transferase CaiB-like acyl-CoA transferase